MDDIVVPPILGNPQMGIYRVISSSYGPFSRFNIVMSSTMSTSVSPTKTLVIYGVDMNWIELG